MLIFILFSICLCAVQEPLHYCILSANKRLLIVLFQMATVSTATAKADRFKIVINSQLPNQNFDQTMDYYKAWVEAYEEVSMGRGLRGGEHAGT